MIETKITEGCVRKALKSDKHIARSWKKGTWYITIDGDIFKVITNIFQENYVTILTREYNYFLKNTVTVRSLNYTLANGKGIASSYNFKDGTDEDNYKKVRKHIQRDCAKARRLL